MEKWAANGVFSPDGRWLACVEFDRETSQCKLLIRSREKLIENESLPLVWGTVGNGCLPVWSADSKRLVISENRAGKDGSIEITYRVFELPTKRMTELKLPEGHWVSGWSRDGKGFLTTFHPKEGSARVAWLDAEGAGKVMFITPEDEPAYDARLSPDNRRILYVAGHLTAKEERNRPRMYSME